MDRINSSAVVWRIEEDPTTLPSALFAEVVIERDTHEGWVRISSTHFGAAFTMPARMLVDAMVALDLLEVDHGSA
jgi:hypothetical protein